MPTGSEGRFSTKPNIELLGRGPTASAPPIANSKLQTAKTISLSPSPTSIKDQRQDGVPVSNVILAGRPQNKRYAV
jgi:hypothetical protein